MADSFFYLVSALMAVELLLGDRHIPRLYILFAAFV